MAKTRVSSLYSAPSQGDSNITYLVNIIADEDESVLQTKINLFLSVTLPTLVRNAFAIQDIKYSSAQLSNNKIVYSAMIQYITYG